MKEIYEYIISILILLMFLPIYSYIINTLYTPPPATTPLGVAESILRDVAAGYRDMPLDYYQNPGLADNYIYGRVNTFGRYGYRAVLHPAGIVFAGVDPVNTYVSLSDTGTLYLYYIDDNGVPHTRAATVSEPGNISIATPNAVSAVAVLETGSYRSIYVAFSIEAVRAFVYGIEDGEVNVYTPIELDTTEDMYILFYSGNGVYTIIAYTPVYEGVYEGLYRYTFSPKIGGASLAAPGAGAVLLWMKGVDGEIVVASPYPSHMYAGAEKAPDDSVSLRTRVKIGFFTYIVEVYVWRQGI